MQPAPLPHVPYRLQASSRHLPRLPQAHRPQRLFKVELRQASSHRLRRYPPHKAVRSLQRAEIPRFLHPRPWSPDRDRRPQRRRFRLNKSHRLREAADRLPRFPEIPGFLKRQVRPLRLDKHPPGPWRRLLQVRRSRRHRRRHSKPAIFRGRAARPVCRCNLLPGPRPARRSQGPFPLPRRRLPA